MKYVVDLIHFSRIKIAIFFLLMQSIASVGPNPAYATEDQSPIYDGSKTNQTEESTKEVDQPVDQPNKEKGYFSALDAPHRSVSSGFEGLAKYLDSFFADEKSYYESTESYIRLTFDTFWEEQGKISFTGQVRIKLDLPNTKKKLKFIIESDPDEGKNDIDKSLEETPRKAASQKSYFVGTEAQLGREDAWEFRPAIGVKIRSPLDLYARIRGNGTYKFGTLSLHLIETLYWFDSIGTGFDTSADLDQPLSRDVLFRSSSAAGWKDVDDFYSLSQVFFIFHKLSDRRGISYQAGVYGLSHPTIFATDYLIAVKYRQTIHSDYLFMEIAPQIRYQKINDFHSEHAILFRFEWVFSD